MGRNSVTGTCHAETVTIRREKYCSHLLDTVTPLGLDNDMSNTFTTETAQVARFVRTCNQAPQISFTNGTSSTNLLPEGMATVGQAIAHGWVLSTEGRWIK